MTKEKTVKKKITATEARLLEGLRQHPKMMERMQSIVELARNQEGPLKTADEVEEKLMAEIRQLGHCTMTQWARTAEERVSTELRTEDSTVRSRKKNAEVVVCFRFGGGRGPGLVQSHAEISAAPARAPGRPPQRTVAPFGTSPDRLWHRAFVCTGR